MHRRKAVSQSRHIRENSPAIRQAARELRKNPTLTETRLWQAISNKKLDGLRFRRQHPVGNFILDFYCPSHKLVIEVDGDYHQQQEQYDDARTEYLEQYGYKVLRFTNQAVMNDLETVLDEIRQATFSEYASNDLSKK